MYLFCGEFTGAGAGVSSINFHEHEELELNQKGTAFRGWYQQGGAHNACLAPLVSGWKMHPGGDAVCKGEISNPASASKLAVYRYREKGCAGLVSLHDACFPVF